MYYFSFRDVSKNGGGADEATHKDHAAGLPVSC